MAWGRMGLGWAEWYVMELARTGWVERTGWKSRDGMAWMEGMGWSGIEKNGMDWHGVGWDTVEWMSRHGW